MVGPESGVLFFQPLVDGQRMDEQLGTGAWLFARQPVDNTSHTVRQFTIGTDALGVFSGPIEAWLTKRNAHAVLVRPDRQIFGTGDAGELLTAWQDKLSMSQLSELATA